MGRHPRLSGYVRERTRLLPSRELPCSEFVTTLKREGIHTCRQHHLVYTYEKKMDGSVKSSLRELSRLLKQMDRVVNDCKELLGQVDTKVQSLEKVSMFYHAASGVRFM